MDSGAGRRTATAIETYPSKGCGRFPVQRGLFSQGTTFCDTARGDLWRRLADSRHRVGRFAPLNAKLELRAPIA